jgi:lipopolysaccharide export system permease protein
MSDVLRWDTIKKNWHAENVRIRTIDSTNETLRTTVVLDTTFVFDATEFNVRKDNLIETMNYFELDKFIDEEIQKGSDEVPYFEIEKYQRMAYPLATFILTLIGVAMSSRKVRGGIGLHIGMGMLISFSFILFMQVAVTLATNANVPAQIAVFIPHMIYMVLALYLIKIAPK